MKPWQLHGLFLFHCPMITCVCPTLGSVKMPAPDRNWSVLVWYDSARYFFGRIFTPLHRGWRLHGGDGVVWGEGPRVQSSALSWKWYDWHLSEQANSITANRISLHFYWKIRDLASTIFLRPTVDCIHVLSKRWSVFVSAGIKQNKNMTGARRTYWISTASSSRYDSSPFSLRGLAYKI